MILLLKISTFLIINISNEIVIFLHLFAALLLSETLSQCDGLKNSIIYSVYFHDSCLTVFINI